MRVQFLQDVDEHFFLLWIIILKMFIFLDDHSQAQNVQIILEGLHLISALFKRVVALHANRSVYSPLQFPHCLADDRVFTVEFAAVVVLAGQDLRRSAESQAGNQMRRCHVKATAVQPRIVDRPIYPEKGLQRGIVVDC